MTIQMLIPKFSAVSEWVQSISTFSVSSTEASWLALDASLSQTWLMHGTHYTSASQSQLDVCGWECSRIYLSRVLNSFTSYTYTSMAHNLSFLMQDTDCKLDTHTHAYTYLYMHILLLPTYIVPHLMSVFMQRRWDPCGLLMFHHTVPLQWAGTSPRGWSR